MNTYVGKESELSNDDYRKISKSELLESNSSKKSFVLGFICSLLEDAKTNYLTKSSEERGSWMKYHAERNGKKLRFEARSIADVMSKRDYFKGFCLFLDEFVPDAWAVLVRNIARSIGLRCIVANTNGKIANLTGKNIVSFSGYSSTSSRCIWSIVITSLGFISWQVLKMKYPDLEAKLNEMIEAVGNEYSEDKKLLKAFLGRQKLEYFRPGIANFFAYSIVKGEFVLDFASFTFAKFLARTTQILAEKMGSRKSDAIKSYPGYAASLALFYSFAYEAKAANFDYFSSSYHDSSFIEKHFYYLINPIDPENCMFITFASTCQSADDKISLVLSENGESKWISEATYFKRTEFMTILSCFNLLPTSDSFYNTFNTARIQTNNRKIDPGSFPNTLASKSDGNRLETFVAASIIDASHHRMGNNMNDFEGQDGISLLNNFVQNLIFQNPDRCKGNFSIDIMSNYKENFNLEEYLVNLKIPFLYPENCEIPEELKEISVQNEDQVGVTRSVYIEKYERPPDSKQVDGIFKCFQKITTKYDSDPKKAKIENFLKRSCVLECKNWEKNVLYGNLEDIIRKQLGNQTEEVTEEIKDEKVSVSEKTDKLVGEVDNTDKSITDKMEKLAVMTEKKDKDEFLVKDAVLSFIICRSIGDSERAKDITLNEFYEFCQKSLVNVFKIIKPNDEKMELVSLLEKQSSDPKLVCIVVELNTLNKK